MKSWQQVERNALAACCSQSFDGYFAAYDFGAAALPQIPNPESEISALLQQSGLPPGSLDLVKGLLSGKGDLESRLRQGSDAVRGILDQMAGPTGQISELVTNTVSKALGIEPSAAGSVGATGGTAIGTALLGPAGGAIGKFVGGTLVGGIADVLSTSPKEREMRRLADDVRRVNSFAPAHGLSLMGKSHHWDKPKEFGKWYKLFQDGKIIITQGKAGSKGNTKLRVKNGSLKEISDAEYEKLRYSLQPNKNLLNISSIWMTARFLKALLQYEAELQAKQKKVSDLKKVAAALETAKKKVQAKKAERSRKPVQTAPRKPQPRVLTAAEIRRQVQQQVQQQVRQQVQQQLRKTQEQARTQARRQVQSLAKKAAAAPSDLISLLVSASQLPPVSFPAGSPAATLTKFV